MMQVEKLHTLLQTGIASGEVQPLPATVFTKSAAEEAFRYMSKGGSLIPAPSNLLGFEPLMP